MHKRYLKGLTIVELMVVIVIISIISGISIASYIYVQKEAQNSQRITHINILANELEKFYDANGEYPPGCPETSCTSSMHTANISSTPLTSTTTLTALRSVLPGIRDDFTDPQSPNKTLPFKNRSVAETKYYYFGGTVNYTASAQALDSLTHTNFPCTIRSSLAAGQIGSYVIGYYDNIAGSWILRGGRNGIQMTVTSGSCVIVRG